MPGCYCLVCGCSEGEVSKLHYFPKNSATCKLWLDSIGITYLERDLRSSRICSKHFIQSDYIDVTTWKLKRNAVPNKYMTTEVISVDHDYLLHAVASTSKDCQASANIANTLTENISMDHDYLSHEVASASKDLLTTANITSTLTENISINMDYLSPAMASTSEDCQKTGNIANILTEDISVDHDQYLAAIPSTSKETSTLLPKKKSLFRGITDLSGKNATPRKRKLMKLVESKESLLRKVKKLAKARANKIKHLCDLNDSGIVKELFKDIPSQTANFLITQIRCSKKSPKGRRWTREEKVLALALYKRGPKCYTLLRKFVAMPTKKTLINLLRQVPFESGINNHMLQHINDSIKDDDHRVCAILMDEMDIKQHIEYDSQSDRLRGYAENGSGFATKALVFIVKGLHHHWKQPVAYYFSKEAITGDELSVFLVDVIKACQKVAKLEIVATINDCGSNNVKALKKLGSSILRPYIEVGEKKIYIIFDPPHLLKCTVSLFRKHNLELRVPSFKNAIMQARFQDIQKAHEIDSDTPLVFRALHKIKAHHLDPKMKYGMKVNLAAQVMSRSVSSYLYTLLTRGELQHRSLATATFVHQVDELFDSFNGSAKFPPTGKDLKCVITSESAHMGYWKKAYGMVNGWRFLRLNKKGGYKKSKPPSQIAWLTTIRAIQLLWNHVHSEKNFQSLKPRTLNQDAIENLFGAIRSGLGCNDNPTSSQFVGSLKTQILNGLIHMDTSKGNCEEYDSTLLSNLNSFLNSEDPTKTQITSVCPADENILNVESVTADIVSEAVTSGSLTSMSVAYVAGFIIKKMLQVNKCIICKDNLLSDSNAPHNLFISFREWSEGQEKLIYPAEAPVVCVGTGITLLEDFLNSHANSLDLSKKIEKIFIENVDFDWATCTTHKNFVIKSFNKAVFKIGLPWWCKRKNREIRSRKNLRIIRKYKNFITYNVS